MTRAKKTDSNQAELVKLGRQLGAKIAITSSAGDGFPDTVWQFIPRNRQNPSSSTVYGSQRVTKLVEIKDGSLSPSRQKLTPDQVEFHAKFKCTIINCESDVYRLMGISP